VSYPRTVTPEILDSLEHDHPDALANRRDLRRLNRIMGNHAWFSRVLALPLLEGDRILELGAGDGTLGQHLRARGVVTGSQTYTGLDTAPRPQSWPGDWPWLQADLTAFDQWEDYDIILGNLIVHQFEDDQLKALGARMRRSARLLAFNEPQRARRHQVSLAFTRLLGFNYVSLRDGAASIHAGFRFHELPEILGLSDTGWQAELSQTQLGAYRMLAIHTAS